MKHLHSLWVALVLLFSANTQAIIIDLVPSQPAIGTGGVLSVAVNISGLNESAAPSLGVYDLDFYFNPDIFSVSNLIWGDSIQGNQLDLNGFGSLQSSTIAAGVINLFELSFDDIGSLNNTQASAFTLFTLVFDTMAPGIGSFSVGVNQLGDAEGQLLMVDRLADTQVVVNSLSVPEPPGFLLLFSLLAIVALRAQLATRAQQ